MTVHDLHDALTLLPGDLVTATDKLRTAPVTKAIYWKRWVSLAACLVLVLSTALVFRQKVLPGMDGAKQSAVAEAPAAAAPMERGDAAADTAAPEAQEAPASGNSSMSQTTEEKAAEEICIDHSHAFAEESETVDEPVSGYCGNTMTTVYLEEMTYTLAGSDSIAMTDILINLAYDPEEVCRCAAEFTVDTETITGIEVNLGQGFARCEQGQAALTEKQAGTIREIIEKLG